MFKVEVYTLQVEERKGTKNGKPWFMRKQPVYMYLPWEKAPYRITVPLDLEQAPWPLGVYQAPTSAFNVNAYGDVMEIRLRHLEKPASGPVPKAA